MEKHVQGLSRCGDMVGVGGKGWEGSGEACLGGGWGAGDGGAEWRPLGDCRQV